MQNFSHSLKIIDQDEIAGVAFTIEMFLSVKQKASLTLSIYIFIYYKWVFSPFQDDTSCFLTPHQFKDTLHYKHHLAKNSPLGQRGAHDAQEKWKPDISTASKNFKVKAKNWECLCYKSWLTKHF